MKIDKSKYSYIEALLQNKEVLRIDAYGNVFLDDKKVGHSDNLEILISCQIKELEDKIVYDIINRKEGNDRK